MTGYVSSPHSKKVQFDLSKNQVYETYSGDQYDRYQIDSVIIRRCYNRVSDMEWLQVLRSLNDFKSNEMVVHKMSLKNTTINWTTFFCSCYVRMRFIVVICVIFILGCIVNLHTNVQQEPYVSVQNYQIKEIPNFLTAEECDTIIQLSEPHLFESRIYSNDQDVLSTDSRQSKQCWLKDSVHSVVEKVSQKTAELTRTSASHQEPLQVVNYNKGGFFRPHYDPCDGSETYCDRMNSNAGPRYITLIIYLNDNFGGGETAFPHINKVCKPEKGKAVVFYNTDMDGNILREALHGGNTITYGNKWICNKWIHLRPYTPP